MINVKVKIKKLTQTKQNIYSLKTKKHTNIDSIYFRGKIHLKEDGIQNYLVFQAM